MAFSSFDAGRFDLKKFRFLQIWAAGRKAANPHSLFRRRMDWV
jgi:hypothetical protein